MADQTETRAEFARRAGVSPAAVTKACKPGGPLAPACDGKLIDLSHEAAKQYLRGKGIYPPRPPTREPQGDESAEPPERYDLPEVGASFREKYPDVSSLLDLDLRTIVDEFGTLRRLREATQARKEIAAAHQLEIKNRERLGELIEREFVRTHLMGALEELSRRLLSDASRTITRKTYAAARSNKPIEEAEAEVRDLMSANLKRAKETTVRKIRNA